MAVDVIEVVESMAVGSVGGLIVKEFVDAGNYTGNAGTISALFTFILLSVIALGAIKGLKSRR